MKQIGAELFPADELHLGELDPTEGKKILNH